MLTEMVLLDVDDFMLAGTDERLQGLHEALKQRFKFGKYLINDSDFIGRHMTLAKNPRRILIDQEKYILEDLHPIPMSKGRRGQSSESLTQPEFEAFSLANLVRLI